MSDEMPSPAVIFQSFTAYQHTAAMRAAIELDLFTTIGQGVATPAELAKASGASERGLRMLCDRLVVDRFLTKEGNRYGLSQTASMFLDRRSGAYVGAAITFLTNPTIVESFTRLTDAVRRGGTALSHEGTIAPDASVWVDFARAMKGLAGFTAELVANLLEVDAADRPLKVLDVAAGHGMFGITIARRNPRAEAVALDWGAVLAVAEENARAAGVADRVRLLPGDAFKTDLGNGYDLVLLPNFLHHFDASTCEQFLRRVRAALAPGGRAVAVEFIPNEDRVSPPDAASFALVMLATTPAGDAFTYAEYDAMFRTRRILQDRAARAAPVAAAGGRRRALRACQARAECPHSARADEAGWSAARPSHPPVLVHLRRGGAGGAVPGPGAAHRRAPVADPYSRFHELLDQGPVAEALIGADRIQHRVKPDGKLTEDELKALERNQPLAARWAGRPSPSGSSRSPAFPGVDDKTLVDELTAEGRRNSRAASRTTSGATC